MTYTTRVAHVTSAHPHLDNRIFRKECVALAEAGLDVYLIAVAPVDQVIANINIVALPKRRRRALRMLFGPFDAWRALMRVKPAMIHIHDPELIPMAVLWTTLTGKPAVYDAHEDLAKQIAGKAYIPPAARRVISEMATLLERMADVMLDGVIVATPAIGRNYRHVIAKVQNFPWLRDYPEPSPLRPTRSVLTLCYVGGITRERGGFEMLRAVACSTRGRQLLLAGSSTVEMAEEISKYTSDRVHYFGLLPAQSIPSVIERSDAGLVILHPLPNYLDSQPTKVFEYMAAGIPFIASKFPAWERLLGKYDCGYFVDPTDIASLEKVLDDLHTNPSEGRAKGSRGRKALADNFTFEAESEVLVRVTFELLTRRSRRHPGAQHR